VAKRAFAGVMLEIFSARCMASMAAFNKETAFSRPFGRWDSVAMVETEDSYEEAVGGAAAKSQNPITAMEMGVHPVIICCVRSDAPGGRKESTVVAVLGSARESLFSAAPLVHPVLKKRFTYLETNST